MEPSRSPTLRRNRIVEDLSRFQSPLLETPEPEARQGRRNFRAGGIQLLDDDGAMSERVSLLVFDFPSSTPFLLPSLAC